jgi:cobalt/nickel transport system permease protein
MHMADALLSPQVGATFWAISGGAIAYSARKLKEDLDDRKIPLMGVFGAFVFAVQMINFTIPGTGSSGHLGGGMILAILLGPYAGFLTLASVFFIQALFFGDGGLLALGCNIFNVGFWTCFVVYPLIYRRLVMSDSSPRRMTVAAVISTLVAMQLGPFSVVMETVLSRISELPFTSFVLLMQPIHLVIGLVEGVVTAGFVAFVRRTRPEILESTLSSRRLRQISIWRASIGFGVAAFFIGGVFSWFASTRPDGLEWSITKIYGTSNLPGRSERTVEVLEGIQDRTTIFPDYGFRDRAPSATGDTSAVEGGNGETRGLINPGTTAAGIVGATMTLGLSVLLGLLFKRRKKRAPRDSAGIGHSGIRA